ncbi:MAG: 4Fe-4S dicluster domain-containing protein [Candidatus Bathyarchaeia archaeon]
MSEEVLGGLETLIREKVIYCFQCGSCVGSCPTARAIREYNPRRIMEELILGRWKEVLSGNLIWLCTLCHTCYEVCPQGVGISHIIVELRNHAAKMGLAPTEYLNNVKQVASTGWTSPLTGAVQRIRKELGLPEVDVGRVDEVRKLMELTELRRMMEEQPS